ncbi:unnamed protein product [Absidia cylindrospora]
MDSSSVHYDMVQKDASSFLNVDFFPFTHANLVDPLIDDESPSPCYTKKTLSKAERRNEYNAIERARRESLNNKFQQLAQALPSMMNYRRPSKSQIVGEALGWVKRSLLQEEKYQYQVMQWQNENKRLLAQLTASHTLAPTTNDFQHHGYDPYVFQQQQDH